MQQQFSRTHRTVVEAIPMAVLADMRVEQPGLIVLHRRVGIAQLHFPRLRRFHFGAGQRNAGLITVQQKEIVTGLPVIAQDLVAVGLSGQYFSSTSWLAATSDISMIVYRAG